jgi:RHS repeat-associated protein
MELFKNNYHPDHLGSSSTSTELSNHTSTELSNHWITDGSGNAIQHLHYLPFGEDWVDQRNSSWNAPYTFSGKEKDAETGYGYFGARYYDSGLSIWLSVDPMSDKYPCMSPYNYCANNPVILVDPDGRKILLNGLLTICQKLVTAMNSFTGIDNLFSYDETSKELNCKSLTEEELSRINFKQKAFYKLISNMITNSKTMTINVVDKDKSVEIGDYFSQSIDVSDMEMFGDGEGVCFLGLLAHEFAEQWEKQTDNCQNTLEDYTDCHDNFGNPEEQKITGYTYTNLFSYEPNTLWRLYKSIDKSSPNVKMSILIKDKNIINVTRK